MATDLIDLHAHTSASDGTTAPEDLVREAAEMGLTTVAITDHDTTAGWDRAADALPAGLSLVRGVELSCVAEGVSLHLLGYLFDPTYPPLVEKMAWLRETRDGRAQLMVDRLRADGYDVSWEQVQRHAGDGTVGRPHVASALLESGVVATREQAFTTDWIGTHGRYWAKKGDLDVLEGMALVHAAGGVTVFAHPGADKRGQVVGDATVVAMAEAGLAGLEVDHVDHDDAARTRLRALAAELDLVTTGSSDFHGARKSVQLGAHTTAPDVLEQLAARATGSEVLG